MSDADVSWGRAPRPLSIGRVVAGAVAVVLLVGAAACGGDDSSGDDAPAGRGSGEGGSGPGSGASGAAEAEDGCTEDRAGGELTMGVLSETAGLDPTVSTGGGTTGGTEIAALFDTLMQYDFATREYVPRLAESLEPNDDHTEWTLTLRPGVAFGSGNPVDAEAVRRSIARHQADDSRSVARANALEITDMEVVDDLTLRFTLAEPWGSFPYFLADMAGMVVDTTVVDELGPDEFNAAPRGAGAGPYEIAEWRPGEEIVMEAREDYWGGPVCLERLRFVMVPGAEATYDALDLGEVQVAYLRDAIVTSQLEGDGVAHFGDVVGLGSAVQINSGFGDPIGADVRVRRAVAHALDPEVVDERVSGGAGIPTSAIFPEGSPVHPDVPGPDHDPDAARELVEEVEADTGWDGSIELMCPTEEQGLTVEAMLDDVGFDAELVVLPIADITRRSLIEHDYDLVCSGMSPVASGPIVRLERYFGTGNSFTGFSDPAFDEALVALKSAASEDEIRSALAEVQEVWNETVPAAGLAAVQPTIAWQDGVHGLTFNENMLVHFDQAWVEGG
jgi:peptide/nickel transport system substrate-binding protein